MLDADSVIAPGFFDACERALGRGRARSRRAARAGAADRWRPRPRSRRSPCRGSRCRAAATGSGLGAAAGHRDGDPPPAALAHRFRAPASEDLVFTLDLLLDGCRCRHVDDARLRSEGADTWSTFGGQKVRYEAGRMAAARAYVPRLLIRAVHHRDACRPRGGVVSGHAAVRARRALAARRARARRAGPRLAAGSGVRSRVARPRARHRHRFDPGEGRAPHLALAAGGPLVPGVEGRGPAARRRERTSARRLLPADRTSLRRRIDFGSPDSQRGYSGAQPSASVSTLARRRGNRERAEPQP